MSHLLDLMKPDIEVTVNKLVNKKFNQDPIAGEYFSKITSVMSSAYKRHGYLLEKSILNRLKENDDFEVWEDKEFAINKLADQIVTESFDEPQNLEKSNTVYTDVNLSRTLQIDAVVYQKSTKLLRCYEIKRGNGKHDAGKTRSIKRDMYCAQVLLKSYGEHKNLEVTSAHSHIIFYYGIGSIYSPWAITGEQMDEHFGFPVWEEVEKVNKLFQEQLRAAL